MKVKVRYFGAIAEKAGKNEELLDLSIIGREVDDLKNFCIERYGLAEIDSLQLAINQELNKQGLLSEGDEIAFLPPFAGG